jgi:hypothetical protein
VLVVPAQHVLVNFGFDLAEMLPRDLDLVCYGERPGQAAPDLYVFDRTEWRWKTLTAADWQAGVGLRSGASKLVLVGAGREALGSVEWARRVQAVDGRRLVDVANAVNSCVRFTPEQWRELAAAYGFKLEDRNVNVRRYGRYGPRGAAKAAIEPVAPARRTAAEDISEPEDADLVEPEVPETATDETASPKPPPLPAPAVETPAAPEPKPSPKPPPAPKKPEDK